MIRYPWAFLAGGAVLLLVGVVLLVLATRPQRSRRAARRAQRARIAAKRRRYDWPAANVQPEQGQVTPGRGGWVYGRPIRDPEQTTVMDRIPGGRRG